MFMTKGIAWRREDSTSDPPSPEDKNSKIQVLHLVSLRNQKAVLSLPQLYRLYRAFRVGFYFPTCSPVLFPNGPWACGGILPIDPRDFPAPTAPTANVSSPRARVRNVSETCE
jgi:hypothetical protein